MDFEDLRSSVQPFAAGSALPLWPAWQNSMKELGKVLLLLPVRPLFLFFLTKLSFLFSEQWAIWENPKLQCSHIIIVNSNFSNWTFSWVQLNLYSSADRYPPNYSHRMSQTSLVLSETPPLTTLAEILGWLWVFGRLPPFPPAACK